MSQKERAHLKTLAVLAKHHGDGDHFAQKMKESFATRFDGTFWTLWERWVVPAYSAAPKVLDLGAGPGLFVKALAERYPKVHVVGIEVAPYMAEAAEALPANAEIVIDDLSDPQLSLADSSVDAAVASMVLHEMVQPLKVLNWLHKSLRPGGRLLVMDWVRTSLETYLHHQADTAKVFSSDASVEELDNLFGHFAEHNRFTREDLIYLLNQTGFAVLNNTNLRDGRHTQIVAQRI